MKSIVLNYEAESKKDNPYFLIILPLTYYGSDCRLDLEVPTIGEIKGEAYSIRIPNN